MPRFLGASAGLLVLAAVPIGSAEARVASAECRGGLPDLVLLEGGGAQVNAYSAECRNGSSHKGLVIPDGAAAFGNGVRCSLGGDDFDITNDRVSADGIRAGQGDRVMCDNGAVFQLRTTSGRLEGGTICDVSDETLFGSFKLPGEPAVDITVETVVIDCGSKGTALIVPQGADTTVDPAIRGVNLRCPAGDFRIRSRANGHRAGAGLVAIAGDRVNDCQARLGAGPNRRLDNFDLTLEPPQSPVTIDFEGLSADGQGMSGLGGSANPNFSFTNSPTLMQDGFKLESAGASRFGFFAWWDPTATAPPYTGSIAVQPQDTGVTTLSRANGGQFDLLSIDLANCCQRNRTVTISGDPPSGPSITVNVGANLQLFSFGQEWRGLTTVTLTSEDFTQYDDIVVDPN